MGQIYIDVAAAQAEMGIMALPASGGGGSTTTSGVWLHWTDAGFTGKGWYWSDPDNYLPQSWAKYASQGKLATCGNAHTTDETGFREHVVEETTTNLDEILGGWGDIEKTYFIGSHKELRNGCVTEA